MSVQDELRHLAGPGRFTFGFSISPDGNSVAIMSFEGSAAPLIRLLIFVSNALSETGVPSVSKIMKFF